MKNYASYSFKLPKAFYAELWKKLEEIRIRENEKYRKNGYRAFSGNRIFPTDDKYEPTAIPSVEILQILIETAYWTSMEREEERPLRFNLSYAKPVEPNESNLCFKDTLPFSERNIIKIAPSIGVSSRITVWNNAQNKLFVWGKTRLSTTSLLMLHAIDPGKVLIQSNAGILTSNIAAVSSGEAHFLSDELGSSYSPIWNHLGREKPESEFDEFLQEKIATVANIIRHMRTLGHGGILILVPPDSSYSGSIPSQSIAYKSQSTDCMLKYCLNAIRECEDNSKEKSEWREHLNSSAQEIADLTAVDGATLLTTEFGLIGYGAKIQAASQIPCPIELTEVEPFSREESIQKIPIEMIGGMRHQSAARFVYDNKDAMALVVSQDKSATCFAWFELAENKPILMAIRKLEISLL
jgi:hypothetical protein